MESSVPPKAALDLRAKLKNVQPKDVEVTHTHKVSGSHVHPLDFSEVLEAFSSPVDGPLV